MSTSPRRAPEDRAPRFGALEPAPLPDLQPFPYASLPATSRVAATDPFITDGLHSSSSTNDSDAAEVAAKESQARVQARQEGEAQAGKIFEERLSLERASVSEALTKFTRDRTMYFGQVESEVVQLALSIARKILHREAQLDPLLLAGIVRVALEKINGATGVVLRIHPQDAADWRRYLATHLEPSDLPEIVEDPAQPPDRCVLETTMGTANIGVEVQLKEIEQGLMDLLAARPGAAS
jgi:flagellar assembly protein FliH